MDENLPGDRSYSHGRTTRHGIHQVIHIEHGEKAEVAAQFVGARKSVEGGKIPEDRLT